MLRSQSIPDIHEKKSSSSSSTSSKLFSAFKRSHNGNTTTSSTEVREKRKSRPLSTSISALNLKISSPILNSQQQQQQHQHINNTAISDENKENINYATNTKQQRESKLKTRSSTPNLNRRSSAIFSHNRTSSIESQAQLAAAATARMLKTNNRLSFMGGNNFQVHNNTRTIAEDDNTHNHHNQQNHHHHHGRHSSTTTTGTSTSHISPATISSQSDSIFDQSSINCIGDEEEIQDGTSSSSELSSIHSTETHNEPLPSSNYIYSKQSTTTTTTKAKSKSKSKNTAATTTIPESPSSSIISTSIPKKLHRTTNLYNLSEFINKLNIEAAAQNGSDHSNGLVMLPIQQPSDQMISMNNRQSIEFENNQIRQLNQQLNQVDNYHCQVKLVENILFLTTTSATQTNTINGGASEKSNRNGFEFDFDLDNEEYLDMLQNEAYNLETCSTTSSANSSVNNWFEADGDQLYLMY